jgi:hypothetical protein
VSLPAWDGDPEDPLPGEQFAYLVTAVYDGRETSPGSPSTGVPPRQLSDLPCP